MGSMPYNVSMSQHMGGGKEKIQLNHAPANFEVSDMHKLHLSDTTAVAGLKNMLKRRTILDRFHKKESLRDNLDMFEEENGGKMFAIREGETIKGFLGLTIEQTDAGRVAHIKSLRTAERNPEMMQALIKEALAYLEGRADTVSLAFSADQAHILHESEHVLTTLKFEARGHDERGYEIFSKSLH